MYSANRNLLRFPEPLKGSGSAVEAEVLFESIRALVQETLAEFALLG